MENTFYEFLIALAISAGGVVLNYLQQCIKSIQQLARKKMFCLTT